MDFTRILTTSQNLRKQYGKKAFGKAIIKKLRGRDLLYGLVPIDGSAHYAATQAIRKNNVLLSGHPIDKIPVVYAAHDKIRINVVTDTLAATSLLGGVATALIVATAFCIENEYDLRIITRLSATNPVDYTHVMGLHGFTTLPNVTFYSDYKNAFHKLELSDTDVFFATSWWSAKAILSTASNRLFYIIQDVETFFYSYGIDHLLCSQIMNRKDIDFIVNSHYLFDYFQKEIPNVCENGCYFDPAFSRQLFPTPTFKTKQAKEKYQLFFYARPNNPRNLFEYGVHLLNEAIQRGILSPDEWEIVTAGSDIPSIELAYGFSTQNAGSMDWKSYGHFLQSIDLTLSLMYTPHPSYPPYDAACSGSVVLTNKFANKIQFGQCANVIMSELDTDTFMSAFEEAIALVKNTQARKDNYFNSTIPREWGTSLRETLSWMEAQLQNVQS